MQLEAIRRQPPGKRGGVRPLLVAALNGVVGQKPGIAAAAQPRSGALPARDVGCVLILHAYRRPVERRGAFRAEVKDKLVAIVEEPAAVDRLVVADGEVILQAAAGPDRKSVV